MKQIETVASFESLHEAYKNVCSKHGNKIAALKFEAHALDGVQRLQNELLSGTYKMGQYSIFEVSYPKKRLVKSCAFKDKIVQRSLCKSLLWVKTEPHLIYDNYASRENKGTSLALKRFKQNLHSYWLNYGTDGYILKMDVHKYFYSINNEILKAQMRRYGYESEILTLIDLIIDSICYDVRGSIAYGLPIGNQTSQVFAVQYPNSVDHCLKDQEGVKYYGRYMDDSYVLEPSKLKLSGYECLAREKYAELDLTLNGKTQIAPIKDGITFLGRRFILDKDGKITQRLTNQNIRHRRRVICEKAALVALGELSDADYWQSFVAWNGYAKRADTYNIRNDMYKFAKETLKNALKQQLRNQQSYKLGVSLCSH